MSNDCSSEILKHLDYLEERHSFYYFKCLLKRIRETPDGLNENERWDNEALPIPLSRLEIIGREKTYPLPLTLIDFPGYSLPFKPHALTDGFTWAAATLEEAFFQVKDLFSEGISPLYRGVRSTRDLRTVITASTDKDALIADVDEERRRFRNAIAQARRQCRKSKDLDLNRLEGRNVFRRCGDYWTVIYDGKTANIRHSKGLEYIAYLLKHPNSDVDAYKLRNLIAGHEDLVPGSAGTAFDEQARDDYEQKLKDIDGELAEAERNNDSAQVAFWGGERQEIVDHLSKNLDLDKNPRQLADDRERARKSVSATIHKALAAIENNLPSLHAHLRKHLNVGSTLSYTPDAAEYWQF